MLVSLVSIETARLAKEKGFIWDTPNMVNNNDVLFGIPHSTYPIATMNHNAFKKQNFTSVPAQSVLQYWLMDRHNIVVWLKPSNNSYDEWSVYIDDGFGRHLMDENLYVKGYDNALEEGLKKALELI